MRPVAAICSSTKCRWRCCATKKYARLAKSEGDDPDKLVARYIDVLNRAVAGRPADMTIGMHLCRGNMESLWMGDGGYAPIAEALFNHSDVDAFLLEYDSARAGDFSPLRHLPAGKRAYLGIVSTKNPALESVDELLRRIEEASHFAPMERLGICPQCGFASAAMSKFAVKPSKVTSDLQTLKDRAVARGRPTGLGPRMSAAADALDSYGLFTAEAVQDPYPYYRQNARTGAGALVGNSAGLVLHPLSTTSTNCRTGPISVSTGSRRSIRICRGPNPERFSDIVDHYNRWLLYRDDDYHDRLKALFLKAMTPRAVERLRPMMQRRVDIILDALGGRDAFDAYLDFAARLPTQVMLDLLGLPDSDEKHDAALERPVLELPVSAGCPRQGGDGKRAARNS